MLAVVLLKWLFKEGKEKLKLRYAALLSCWPQNCPTDYDLSGTFEFFWLIFQVFLPMMTRYFRVGPKTDG